MLGLTVDTDRLAFMVGKRICSISQVGKTTLVFIDFESATLNVECFWRLREPNRMIITSEDKKYPDRNWSKDPIEEIKRTLTGQIIRACIFVEETEDLFIQFDEGTWLDVLINNTMFESWQLDAGKHGYFVGKA